MNDWPSSKINTIEKQLISLATVLDKLWKIIQHSDPTASSKKHTFYEKYNQKLQSISKDLKESFKWSDIQQALKETTAESLQVSDENFILIRNKLTKDLSSAILDKLELPQFEKPVQSRKKAPKPKMTVKRPKQPKPPEQGNYTKETLLDMVQQTKATRQARKDLEKVIEKIRQIGPEKIEQKIKKLINES